MPKDGETRDDAVGPGEDAVADEAQQADHVSTGTSGEGAAPGESSPDQATGTEPDPIVAIGDLEREIADLKDQLLRTSADFDNYRKRMHREKEEFAAYANRELLLDIVPIIDDFERAIKSSEESQDFQAFHNGIVMIEKQFTSMLERKWKLIRFDSVGEEFDPQRHEAMMTEPVPGHDHSVVLEDFQKGYLLHEKVLRPAKVKVSMPAPAVGSGESGDDTPGGARDAGPTAGDGDASGDA